MKYLFYIFIALLPLISTKNLYAQKYVPFIQDLRGLIEVNGLSIMDVRYYNGSEIEVMREATKDEIAFNKSNLRFEQGKYYFVVRFPAYSSGVCLNSTDNFIEILFDKENKLILRFGKYSSVDEIYRLGTFSDESECHSTELHATMDYNHNIIERYDGQKYVVTKGAGAVLMMRQIGKSDLDVEKRKAKKR